MGSIEELLTVKNELAVVMRTMDDRKKESLKDFVRQNGSEILTVSPRKNSLVDLFVKIIKEEKKT